MGFELLVQNIEKKGGLNSKLRFFGSKHELFGSSLKSFVAR